MAPADMMLCDDRVHSQENASTTNITCVTRKGLHDIHECRQVVQHLCNQTRPLSQEEVEHLVSWKVKPNSHLEDKSRSVVQHKLCLFCVGFFVYTHSILCCSLVFPTPIQTC